MFGGFEPGAIDFGSLFLEMVVFGGGLVVGHREVEAYRHVGPDGLHGFFAFGVGSEQAGLGFRWIAHEEAGKFRGVDLLPYVVETHLHHLGDAHASRRTGEVEPVEELWNIWFVEGGGVADDIAEMTRGAFAEAGEEVGSLWILPSTLDGEPAGQGEVRVGEHRGEVMFVADGEHAAVVVELGIREDDLLRARCAPIRGRSGKC